MTSHRGALVALDHAQVAMPKGGEDAARGFYGELLGMSEVPKPPRLAVRGGCWFEVGAVKLHLGVEDDFRPAKKAHVALLVAGLDDLQGRLAAAGRPVKPDDEIDGVKRFFSEDPFGNRVEFIEA